MSFIDGKILREDLGALGSARKIDNSIRPIFKCREQIHGWSAAAVMNLWRSANFTGNFTVIAPVAGSDDDVPPPDS